MGLLGETDFAWGNVDSGRGAEELAVEMDDTHPSAQLCCSAQGYRWT